MNKKLLCAALLAGLGMAQTVSAQDFDDRWYVSGGTGVNFQDGGAIDSFFGGHLGIRYTFGGPAPAPAPVVAPPAKTCADLDDDSDGVNNCDDKCPASVGQSGPDGCPVPAPEPMPEPKPFRN